MFEREMMVEEVEEASNNGSSTQEGLLVSSCDNAVPSSVSVGGMVGPTRRSTKGGWTEEEDKILAAAVKRFNCRNWRKIAECVPGKTNVQCLHRWQKVLNPDLVKGPWKKEEDDLIRELVAKQGNKKWAEIAKFLPGRMGKQCRERTENSIKNNWNCSVKKRLEKYGAEAYIFSTESEARIFKLDRQRFDQKINSARNSYTVSLDLSIGRAHIRDCQLSTSEKGHHDNEDDAIEPEVGTIGSRVTSDLSSKGSRTCESNDKTIECSDNISTVQYRNSADFRSPYPSKLSDVSFPLSLSSPVCYGGRKGSQI